MSVSNSFGTPVVSPVVSCVSGLTQSFSTNVCTYEQVGGAFVQLDNNVSWFRLVVQHEFACTTGTSRTKRMSSYFNIQIPPDCSGMEGLRSYYFSESVAPDSFSIDGCQVETSGISIQNYSGDYSVPVVFSGLPDSSSSAPSLPIPDDVEYDETEPAVETVEIKPPVFTVNSEGNQLEENETIKVTSSGRRIKVTRNEDGTISYSDYSGSVVTETRLHSAITYSDESKTVTETVTTEADSGSSVTETFTPTGASSGSVSVPSTVVNNTTQIITDYNSSGDVTGSTTTTGGGSGGGAGGGTGGNGDAVTVTNLGTLETNTGNTASNTQSIDNKLTESNTLLGEIRDKFDGLTEEAGTFDDLSGTVDAKLEETGISALEESMSQDGGSQGVNFTTTIGDTFQSFFPQSPACVDMVIPISNVGHSMTFKCSDTQGFREILYWLFSLMTIYYLYSLFVTSNKKD